jgi:hypothetical protein
MCFYVFSKKVKVINLHGLLRRYAKWLYKFYCLLEYTFNKFVRSILSKLESEVNYMGLDFLSYVFTFFILF